MAPANALDASTRLEFNSLEGVDSPSHHSEAKSADGMSEGPLSPKAAMALSAKRSAERAIARKAIREILLCKFFAATDDVVLST